MAFTITLEPSGHSYQGASDRTLLGSGLDAGLNLPYSCRAGHCRTCRGKVIVGAVDHGEADPLALSEAQRAEGYALLCRAKPLSDLTVQVQELSSQVMAPRIIPCRVKRVHKPTADVAIVTLRLAMNENLMFAAGQFIDLLLADGQTRSYSIATSPRKRGVAEIELHMRHSPGGLFTDRMFGTDMEGEILQFRAPLGSFYLRGDSDKPIVLLASGTGFAPIKAMVEFAQASGSTRPMTLYWGGRAASDLYMDEIARQWERDIPGFRYVPVVSEGTAADGWGGRRGFVHRAVMDDHPDLSGYQVYACGAPVMVEAARAEFFTERGLDEADFFADSFFTAAEAVSTETSASPSITTHLPGVPSMRLNNALAAPVNAATSVVKPEYFSHGTLECYSLKASRRFYEEFLGLDCVRHGRRSMAIRCGMKFHVVCLQVGSRLRPCTVDNHWGLDVSSPEEVTRIWKAAIELKDTYQLRQITEPVEQHGAYSFYLEDLDHNWWEIQYYDGMQHEDMYDFGDRFTEADLTDADR